MKLLQSIGFAILGMLALNNSYQFIGTDYIISYYTWVCIGVLFIITAIIYFYKKEKI